jgi:hypothetical protein
MWLVRILLKLSATCFALASVVDRDNYQMLWAIGCYLVAVTV